MTTDDYSLTSETYWLIFDSTDERRNMEEFCS